MCLKIVKCHFGKHYFLGISTEAPLSQPLFESGYGGFGATLRKDVLSEDLLKKYNLTERQKQALQLIQKNKEIMNTDYRCLMKVARSTVTKELISILPKKGLLKK